MVLKVLSEGEVRLIFKDFRRLLNIFPLLSMPIFVTRFVSCPRDFKLAATLAAPPGFSISFSIFKTGTGASGDILLVLPNEYLSSIASPITKIFDLLNRLIFFISIIYICFIFKNGLIK